MEPSKTSGGIENTLVYWLSDEVYRLNYIFITMYISRYSRTYKHKSYNPANRGYKRLLFVGRKIAH